jgi:hypothetical protein
MLDFPLWKRILILVVCSFGVLYAAPNFMPSGWPKPTKPSNRWPGSRNFLVGPKPSRPSAG